MNRRNFILNTAAIGVAATTGAASAETAEFDTPEEWAKAFVKMKDLGYEFYLDWVKVQARTDGTNMTAGASIVIQEPGGKKHRLKLVQQCD